MGNNSVPARRVSPPLGGSAAHGRCSLGNDMRCPGRAGAARRRNKVPPGDLSLRGIILCRFAGFLRRRNVRPDELTAISTAFKQALGKLGVRDRDGEAARRVALRTMTLAKRGRDRGELCAFAVGWCIREDAAA